MFLYGLPEPLETQIHVRYRVISRFIGHVLSQYFSVEDDYGNRIVPHEFRNPIPDFLKGR